MKQLTVGYFCVYGTCEERHKVKAHVIRETESGLIEEPPRMLCPECGSIMSQRGKTISEVRDALADHEDRRAAGTLGERIEARCPACDYRAWSYTAYSTVPIAEARAWLLAQHDCPVQGDKGS